MAEAVRNSRAGRALRTLGWFLGCGLCIAGFYDARQINSGFALPAAGVYSVPETEQVMYLWYAVCGTAALLCLAMAFTELGVVRALRRLLESALERPVPWIVGIALLVFASSLAIRHGVLLDQPIADDEGTYLFVARTLLAGRVTNPVPQDAAFFKNQFLVVNDHGWHGKYPLGHPLVLAIGEAIGAIDLVMPLVAALCVWLTYHVGTRLFDARIALVGASLLLVSPHFVWTAATLLSQPTLCLAMLAGMYLVLRWQEHGRTRDVLLAGVVFGFGVLVRPLPGALFALAAAAEITNSRRESVAQMLGRLTLFGVGAAPWIVVFAAVNYLQSGDIFTSGYHEVHGSNLKVLYNDRGQVVNSVVGGLLRENFWLLGWTFAMLLLPFARPARGRVLFWGMLAAELAYRVIAPKTVVSVTGPIYLTEVVPLLTLAVAAALSRLGAFFRESAIRPSVVAVAATLIGWTMFVPLQLHALATGAATRRVVYDYLEKAGAERALIFANVAAHPENLVTWAYFPDIPSPQLDDAFLFVRVPTTADRGERMLDFWRRRFPDRRAFVFAVAKDGPLFNELNPR